MTPPLICVVGSTNPVKVNAASAALEKVLGAPVTVQALKVPSGVPDQPLTGEQTRLGAINRVRACLTAAEAAARDRNWFIAIEGGVDNLPDGPATFAYTAIYHQQVWSVSRSASMPIPPAVYQALLNGEELGDVMDRLFNTTNVKQQGGAIGLLTRHQATRQSVYETALILALARFTHPQLYTQPGQ